MKLRIAACLALLACAGTAGAADAPGALPPESAYHLEARLTDDSGRALAWRDLRGKARIATMFYASCRFACPLTIDTLRAVERALAPAERERVGFVLVTMDPEDDTPEVLARVRTERKLTEGDWLLLRPEPVDLRALAGILDIRFRALADGEFNHTTGLVLLDADGREVARTERLGPPEPEFLAAVRRTAAPPAGQR